MLKTHPWTAVFTPSFTQLLLKMRLCRKTAERGRPYPANYRSTELLWCSRWCWTSHFNKSGGMEVGVHAMKIASLSFDSIIEHHHTIYLYKNILYMNLWTPIIQIQLINECVCSVVDFTVFSHQVRNTKLPPWCISMEQRPLEAQHWRLCPCKDLGWWGAIPM